MGQAFQSHQARFDLVEIGLYIAEESPNSALEFLDTIEQKCEMLATNPEMGRTRRELAPGLRSYPAGNYVIFYREVVSGIEIARVLHGLAIGKSFSEIPLRPVLLERRGCNTTPALQV
jgi:toxin ParE1/3/4